MNILYIIEFVRLAETCSFSEAADQLFISQSSLSKHVKQLEAELNVSLFDRSTRNVVLSPAGEAFLPYAKEFSNLWQATQKAMGQLSSGEELQLTIGTMNPLKSYRIPNFINQFYQQHPNSHIITRSLNQLNFRDNLLNGSLSFAIVPHYMIDDDDDALDRVLFTQDSLDVMVHADHPLASRESVSLTEFRDEPYIGLPHDSPIYKRNSLAFKKAGFEPNTVMRFEFHEAHVDCVKHKLGYGLSLHKPSLNSEDPEIRFIPLDPPTIINVLLVYRRRKRFTRLEKDFIAAATAFSKD